MFLKRNRAVSEQHPAPAPTHSVELPVVPEWEALVRRADAMAAMIDQHLDYESALQGRDLSVGTLCPEQKSNLVADLSHVAS